MRIRISALSFFMIALAATRLHAAEPSSQLDASREKLGYAIGHQVGHDFRQSGEAIDVEALVAGMRDALRRASPRWTPEEMREALRRLEERQRRVRAGKADSPDAAD
jgi:hypothetical protein